MKTKSVCQGKETGAHAAQSTQVARRAFALTLLIGVTLAVGLSSCADPDDVAAADEQTESPAAGQGASEVAEFKAELQAGWVCRTVPGGGGEGCISSSRARACDSRADGLGVTTWYAGPKGGGNVGDYNGSSGGCGEEGPDMGGTITHFHVCKGGQCTGETWL
jgi:hypothetical protein